MISLQSTVAFPQMQVTLRRFQPNTQHSNVCAILHLYVHIFKHPLYLSLYIYIYIQRFFARRHEDHQLVTLQLQWVARHHLRKPKYDKNIGMNIDYKDPLIKEGLMHFHPEPWHVDVEQQADHLVQHLRHSMGSLRKQQAVSAKKPYVTPEVWQYRLKKLQCRQINKQIRRRLATEALHQVFKAWTHSATTSDLAQFFNYGTSLRCSQVKAFLGFCKYRKMMRSQLQQSKSTFLKQRLSQLPENSAAADILKELKPFIGPTNPRKQKKATLPMVHNADDQPCTLPTEALAVWVDFFRDMEGGSRVTEAQLRTQWIDNLQSFRQTAFQLSMEEVPTLTDMELACRRVACKKATGPDKVPGEVCRFHPELLAPVTYTQMLKLVLHGQEPLLFKGGLLVPAYKGKGPTYRVNSFRSLLISSHLGKVIHRCIRQHKADAYEKYL